jgi:hypothetical protein
VFLYGLRLRAEVKCDICVECAFSQEKFREGQDSVSLCAIAWKDIEILTAFSCSDATATKTEIQGKLKDQRIVCMPALLQL